MFAQANAIIHVNNFYIISYYRAASQKTVFQNAKHLVCTLTWKVQGGLQITGHTFTRLHTGSQSDRRGRGGGGGPAQTVQGPLGQDCDES